MIISHAHQFVFIEVPHTGSHSISSELISLYEGELILRKHANISQFMAQATVDERKYFKFATVRNPLDYMVTQYFKYKSNHKGQYTNAQQLLKNGGHVTSEHLKHFNFVHEEDRTFDQFLLRFFNRTYNNWFLLGSKYFDFVIKFENLQQDYRKVLDLMGLEFHRPLPHINPTAGKDARDYRDYYPDSIMDSVLRNYGPFMHKWGYDLPRGKTNADIPFSSKLRFKLVDKSVDFSSGYLNLNPDAPYLKKAKDFVDRLL